MTEAAEPSEADAAMTLEETVVDDGQVPTTSADEPEPEPAQSPAKVNQTPEEQAVEKRRYVLMELVETEKDYVRDLGLVVDGYMKGLAEADLPESLKGKDTMIFANIVQIYEFHRDTFKCEMDKGLEDYAHVARTIKRFERRLQMYVKYCQNKPLSEFIVADTEFQPFFNEIKLKLGHKLALPDLLIKPVQRIMKYQLLLKDILKYTERAGQDCTDLNKAMRVMHVVPKECDDMMHVGRLQGFADVGGKITAQGKLLLQGTLLVSENPPTQAFKGKEKRIFVFEQSIIIADYIRPKTEFGNPNYIYKSHIQVNKMDLTAEVAGEPLRFILRNKDPSTQAQFQAFLIQTNDEKEQQEWINRLKDLLNTQQNFLKALQSPIEFQKNETHQKELEKTNSTGSGGAGGAKDKKKPLLNRLTGKNHPSKPSIPEEQGPSESPRTPTSVNSAGGGEETKKSGVSVLRNRSFLGKKKNKNMTTEHSAERLSSAANPESPREQSAGSRMFNGFKSLKQRAKIS